MQRIMAVLSVLAMLFGAVSLAVAESGDQPAKAKTVAKTVKSRGGDDKMMPEPEVQLKRLAKGLQLTAEQQQLIRPMLAEEYTRLKEIREDEDLSPKQIQSRVELLRTETVAQIQTVLTPEQKENHDLVSDEIKANKQKRMQENRKARLGTKADPPKQLSQ